MKSMMKTQAKVKSIRVLIVDDIARVRKDLRTVLLLTGNEAGITIEIIGEAADGEEAVHLAETLQPEVILMDLVMPVLDGFEATRQIKKHSPACRVIALTVHDYEAARQKAAQSGVDVLFVKGEPVEKLVEAIAGQAQASSAAQQG